MIHEETIQKLVALKLAAMAAAARELATSSPSQALTVPEVLGMIVDRECVYRENRRLARLMREAHLAANAPCLEDVICEPARGIEKSTVRSFGTCQWVRAKQNIIILGATGTGKTYVGSALAQAACRNGLRAYCVRTSRLLHDVAIARADGSYAKLLDKVSRADVLVLDDFLIAPLKETERRDLLEVLEDRYGRASTVITTQLPTKSWHEALGDPTIADAICDRMIHNAHVVQLRGGSMRKRQGLNNDQG